MHLLIAILLFLDALLYFTVRDQLNKKRRPVPEVISQTFSRQEPPGPAPYCSHAYLHLITDNPTPLVKPRPLPAVDLRLTPSGPPLWAPPPLQAPPPRPLRLTHAGGSCGPSPAEGRRLRRPPRSAPVPPPRFQRPSRRRSIAAGSPLPLPASEVSHPRCRRCAAAPSAARPGPMGRSRCTAPRSSTATAAATARNAPAPSGAERRPRPSGSGREKLLGRASNRNPLPNGPTGGLANEKQGSDREPAYSVIDKSNCPIRYGSSEQGGD